MSKTQDRESLAKSPSVFVRLRVAMAFILAVLAFSFGFYYLHVQRKSDYLTSRNFRLLASMGKRIEATVKGQARALKNLSDKSAFMDALRKEDEQRVNDVIRVLAPQFESVKLSGKKGPDKTAKGWHETVSGPDGPAFRFFHAASEKETLEAEVKLGKLVELPLASRGAFETVLLADRSGEVIYQQGAANLGITHLSALANHGGKAPAAETLFEVSEHLKEVELAGKSYRLFVEPFSLPIQAHGDKKGSRHQETWLLCGLIPEKDQVLKSMAVSSALLLLLLGALLLALLSWPFLKLRLLGERQRVRRLDVALVGLCSLAGASIATLAVLDLFAFHRFRAQAETQVESLAREMEERVLVEVFKAHEQLVALEGKVKGADPKKKIEKDGEPFNSQDAYPYWDSFTLVDSDGMQKGKWTTASVVSTLIDVKERSYFQKVRDEDLWRLKRNGQEIALYVQSIVTSTRGTKEVVLAKPSAVQGFAVSVLMIPMPSLIDPVLPPGFHFAVIDNTGKVLFHSQSVRNLSEDFFAETDQDRHLRSTVFAKRAETMGLRYWGDDYIARVEPVDGLPWTIVALREKSLLRDVNLGWIVTTISSVLVYLGLLVAVVIVVLAVRPSYRASWLWPDRGRDYLVVSNVLLILVLAFSVAICLLPGGSDLFALSILFPFLALSASYLRLGRPEHRLARGGALTVGTLLLGLIGIVLLHGSLDDDALPGSRPVVVGLAALAFVLAAELPRRDEKRTGRIVSPDQCRYAWAGVLLLLLTSILPTLGFFESARREQSRSFVKHGQLRLALSLEERARRVRQEARRERYKEPERGKKEGGKEKSGGWKDFVDHRLAILTIPEAVPERFRALETLKGFDVYSTPFFGTTVARLREKPAGEQPLCESDSGPVRLAKVFQERLPKVSESSVQMQDLWHGASSDCTWQWLPATMNSSLKLLFATYPDGGFTLTSDPGIRQMAAEDLLEAVAWVLLIVILAWLVEFISRNVFLLDPTDPAWPAGGRGPARPGLRQLVVSRRGDWTPAAQFFEIDLCALRDGPPESGDRWRRLIGQARGQDVLIRGLKEILEDESFEGEALELLEKLDEKHQNRVVILSKTSQARLFPSSASRNGKRGPSESEERWRALLAAFEVDDQDRRSAEGSQIEELHPVLLQECGSDRDLLEIAWGLNLNASSKVTPEQALDELGEAAESHYRSLWAACSAQEEVVLEHLAEDGFVSEKNRRTVRKLIAGGLVKRDPHLRLMNETFRRFAASATCKSQVRAVEQQTEPSAWDRLRVPFFVGLATSLFFLFTTQQALLDGAAGTVAGVAAGIPALLQMMEVFGGRIPGMK